MLDFFMIVYVLYKVFWVQFNYFWKLSICLSMWNTYFVAFSIKFDWIYFSAHRSTGGALQTSGVAQGRCSSSMLVYLFLNHYECNYKNNNLQLYRYIYIILISIDNANFSLPVKYPAYLTLTCTNLNNNLINFLD